MYTFTRPQDFHAQINLKCYEIIIQFVHVLGKIIHTKPFPSDSKEGYPGGVAYFNRFVDVLNYCYHLSPVNLFKLKSFISGNNRQSRR